MPHTPDVTGLLRLLATDIGVPAVLERLRGDDIGARTPEQVLHHELAAAAEVVAATPLTEPAAGAFAVRLLLPRSSDGPITGGAWATPDPHGPPMAPVFADVVRRLHTSSVERGALSDLERTALQHGEAVILQQRAVQALAEAASDPTSIHHRLAPEDRARLEDVLIYMAIMHCFKTLDGWLERWQFWAAYIAGEKAISVDLDDLHVALNFRDAVEMAVSALAPPSRDLVQPKLDASDGAYFAATRPLPGAIPRYGSFLGHPRRSWEPKGWWWTRVPRATDAQFDARLRHLSLL